MIDSELHPRNNADADADLGPPILLKRLGNAVEANLAKNKLATAGIPAFLGGENTFAGDVMHPLPYREVELFVPKVLVEEALAVLNAPPSDPSELFGDPYLEDPSIAWSFRAFVCSVVGWLFLVLGAFDVIGILLSAPVLVYAIVLGFRACFGNTMRSSGTFLKAIVALILAALGLGLSAVVLNSHAR